MTFNTMGAVTASNEPPDAPEPAPREPRKTFGYKLVLFMWLIYMYEPQTWIQNAYDIGVAGKLPLALSLFLIPFLLLKFPSRIFLPAFAAIVVFLVASLRFAFNPAYAEIPTKQAVMYYILALGLVAFVKTPKQAVPMIQALMLGQFVWWVVWGIKDGGVIWHYQWYNYDGYGPLMALGIAGAFHYGMAAKSKMTRRIAFATAVACVLGLVSTFARGAFLGLIAVVVWMWFRSPRKGVATVSVAVAIVAVFVASMMFTGTTRGAGTASNFFDEMSTMFNEAKQGSGTTGDREVLWTAATKVWLENPLFGAGGGNFGVFASSYFRPGDIGGDYDRNPKMLYDRKLHNVFFQVLSEYGLIGTLLYVWLLVDFFSRNRRLRTPAFLEAWEARGGGALDLNWISLGLTGLMIAFLSNGMFYNLIECNFLPATVIMNALLYHLAKPDPRARLSRTVELDRRGYVG